MGVPLALGRTFAFRRWGDEWTNNGSALFLEVDLFFPRREGPPNEVHRCVRTYRKCQECAILDFSPRCFVVMMFKMVG